jgi:hypothetical protein
MEPNLVNENYKVIIITTSGDTGKTTIITGHTPDKIKLQFGSSYESLVSKSLSKAAKAINQLSAPTGHVAGGQIYTAKLWSGSKQAPISFNMIFDAETDPYKDVVLPVTQLIRMLLPEDMGSGGTKIPGPRVLDRFIKAGQQAGDNGGVLSAFTKWIGDHLSSETTDKLAGDETSIHFGPNYHIDPVLIKDLSIEVPTRFDGNGLPIRMEVSLTIEPYYDLYKNNLPFTSDDGDRIASENTVPLTYGFYDQDLKTRSDRKAAEEEANKPMFPGSPF